MKRTTYIKGALIAALAFIGWLIWPAYGFLAHSGDVPLLPFGWTRLTDDPPASQTLYDPAFQQAGDAALQALTLRREEIGAPGMSAAVAVNGELVWVGVTGWADIRQKKPVTPETQFRIGSTSKALTATALARLVDQNFLTLDQPLQEIMQKLPNDAWAQITPRQLASHMAGIPHYGENTELGGLYQSMALRKYYTPRQAVSLFDQSDMLFEPGSDFSYSSLGTVLLGAAMSEAAGQPYMDIIQDEVLKPAGANSTIIAPKRAPRGSSLATFYLREGEKYRPWRPVDLSHRLPGGGFAATPSDLVKIGNLQLQEAFLNPQTRSAFWTPQRLNDGTPNEQDYAIGWRWKSFEVEGLGVLHNANHGGVSRGSQSWLMVIPEHHTVIAMNTNMRTDPFWDFGSFYEELARAFIPAQSR